MIGALTTAWVFVGLALAITVDWRATREEPPYSRWPSYERLRDIRITLYLLCLLFWPFVVAEAVRRKRMEAKR